MLLMSLDPRNRRPLFRQITDQVRDWVAQVRDIAPAEAQISSLARPVPSREIEPASTAALEDIRDRLLESGLRATAF